MAKDVKAGGAYVEIGGKDDPLDKALAGARKKVEGFKKGVAKGGKSLMKAGAVMMAPLVAGTMALSNYGDKVAKIARRTGLSTEAVSELGYAAEITGASVETLERSFKGLGRIYFDASRGTADAVDTLKALDLTFEDLKGKSPEDQFMLLGEKLAGLKDQTLASALAQRVFGRAGMELLPLFREGRDGIEKLRARAKELGISMSGEAAAGAEWLQDALGDVKRMMLGLSLAIGQAILPALKEMLPKVISMVSTFRKWIVDNKDAVVGFGKLAIGLLAVGAALVVLAKLIGVVMVLLSPAGLIGVAVAGLAAILAAVTGVDLGFSDLVGSIRVGGVKLATWWTALGVLLLKVWARASNWIVGAWEGVVNFFQDAGGVMYRGWVQVSKWIWEAFSWVIEKAARGFNWLAEQINSIMPDGWEVPEIDVAAIAKAGEQGEKVYEKHIADSLKARDERSKAAAAKRLAREKKLADEIANLNEASSAIFAKDAADGKAGEDPLGKRDKFEMNLGDKDFDFGSLKKKQTSKAAWGTFSGALAGLASPKTKIPSQQLDALREIVAGVEDIAANTRQNQAAVMI